ncbi:hypothetical protein KVP10_08295 [Candidimonas humi]|uniref:Uncharacterized protein n=1 Tax=Candidimonas humi TaxID=683355 RepID=A0ABV8NYX2_9BURK|nr:hypothetical protein [Candidimonas humi]MBV6304885.1 hypothetical protein [Candidimonas humi]
MSTRTIIEINRDYLGPGQCASLCALVNHLGLSVITGELNRLNGDPMDWHDGIRVLAQRHHSETLELKVE